MSHNPSYYQELCEYISAHDQNPRFRKRLEKFVDGKNTVRDYKEKPPDKNLPETDGIGIPKSLSRYSGHHHNDNQVNDDRPFHITKSRLNQEIDESGDDINGEIIKEEPYEIDLSYSERIFLGDLEGEDIA